jgi:multicomponent K+:H+ antiporter subunit G
MNSASLVELLVVVLLASGVFFSLVGSLGLLRLSDFMRRLHGPTKATTLGVGSILIAAMLLQSMRDASPDLRELLITLFLFLSAPVSAMLMAKAAMATDASAKPPPAPGSGEQTQRES